MIDSVFTDKYFRTDKWDGEDSDDSIKDAWDAESEEESEKKDDVSLCVADHKKSLEKHRKLITICYI